MKRSRLFFIHLLAATVLLLSLTQSALAQNGTIANRETADPGQTGYAVWIKITIQGGPGGNDNLDDNFNGVKLSVDLNLDFDDDIATRPNDVYDVRGSDGDIKSSPSGVNDKDKYFYIPVRLGGDTPYPPGETGYRTNIRPRVMLQTSGQLRVGTSPFQFPIGVDTGYEICSDGIKPLIRAAYYYDDGSGSTNPTGDHKGNNKAFDGYIDRIDLIWSEPMRTGNTAVLAGMFSGLGSSIHSFEPTGALYQMYHTYSVNSVSYSDTVASRFTFWVRSSQANTGITPILTYNPPASEGDRFKEYFMWQYPTKILNYAESQSRALTDKAGPAIVSARTIRAQRRQPLANALTSKRIEVTFSEPVLLSTVALIDFTVQTTAANPNPIAAIISPVLPTASSSVYEFQLTTNFASGNETGSIEFVSANVVGDLTGNANGRAFGAEPPLRPYDSFGFVIPIDDGILPIIIKTLTVDANLATELATGGQNGWGYLDYLDVVFDHAMNTGRNSTSGFVLTGSGIQTVGGTGVWLGNDTLRVPLVASSPKRPNTGVIPVISYSNPGDPFGLEASNGGNTENLLTTDTNTSANNGLALVRMDNAGPAIIRAYTAGKKRIRVSFSEEVNTTTWPTTQATAQVPSRFKWFVGPSVSDPATTTIFFTGLSASRRDTVAYLNHTGSAWDKTHSGGINFFAQMVVYDVNGVANRQWDNDNSLLGKNRTGSDVEIRRDNIAPILLNLETVDLNRNGRLDHYRLVFDWLSPVFPKTSFKPVEWRITGYDGLKAGLAVDLNVYNPGYQYYQPSAINTFGDTVEVFVKFNETSGRGPEATPFGGDTGDVPDVQIDENKGFADWADNVMAALPTGITLEKDKAGPAIMSAKTINTTQVEVLMSEKLMENQLGVNDYGLIMGMPLNLRVVEQVENGKIILSTFDQSYWLPTQTGTVALVSENAVYDDISGPDNGNLQTASIAVVDNAASQFSVNLAVPGDQIRGVPFQIEVIARDSHGNIDTNFPERILFSCNYNQNEVDLPDGSQELTNGIGYFWVTSWITTENLVISVSVNSDRYARYYGKSDPITIIEPVIDAPDTLIVTDYLGADGLGDQGGSVLLTWDYSENHPGIGTQNIIHYYQLYREINTGVAHWGTVTATDTTGSGADSMRVVIPAYDNVESRWWVRAVWRPNWPGMTGSDKTGVFTAQSATRSDGVVYMDNLQPVQIRQDGKMIESDAVDTILGTNEEDQVVSAATMGIGRAIDNVAPKAPDRFHAQKEGDLVKLHWSKVVQGVNGLPEISPVRYELFAHTVKAHFNPDVEGTLLATLSDTLFMLNSDELRHFFCLRAVDSDNKSNLAKRLGKYGYLLDLDEKPIYNYLSVPLLSSTLVNAKAVAAAIPGLEVLLQLDPATNNFSRYYLPSINFGNNFKLTTGSPVLVSANQTAPTRWFYTGEVPLQNAVRFKLNRSAKGSYNEITLPLDKPDIKNADQLAKAIGGVIALFKLDPVTNAFSKFWLPDLKYGDNFALQPGEPVLIQVNDKAPAEWPAAPSITSQGELGLTVTLE